MEQFLVHDSADWAEDTSVLVAEMTGVSKLYGQNMALRQVDLAVRSGEILALLGPNGAGKTSSVATMIGMIQPTRGQAKLFGLDPRNRQARMRCGVMLQISGLPDTLMVREHIELFSSYYPAPLPLGRVLATSGLERLANRPYRKLSGGEKQRLHFALAICGDPELLFLDEPTVGLDVESRRAFWDQIRSLTGQGRTVVLTTHYLEEADALADRIVVLRQGRIVAEGTPAQIKGRTAGRRVRIRTVLPEEEVAQIPGVTSLKRVGARLELLTQKAEPVVLTLLQRDPGLQDLEVGGVGLEEAFLDLVQSNDGGEETAWTRL